MTLLFDLILVNLWGYRGIALASMLTQTGWALSFFLLSRKLVNKPFIKALSSLYKSMLSALVVGCLIWGLDTFWINSDNYLLWLKLAVAIGGGAVLYFLLQMLLHEPVTMEMVGKLRRRLGHQPI